MNQFEKKVLEYISTTNSILEKDLYIHLRFSNNEELKNIINNLITNKLIHVFERHGFLDPTQLYAITELGKIALQSGYCEYCECNPCDCSWGII